ncbi:hypothetical protein [Flavobacterium limnosediminis]|uniref:hypothetical protein n=1 Tax=Flavobacterium limnosediminis TaxID=1401027 RepID=UPI000421FC17|nr:hypothetical protein [Flavobacterium limnosediminis]
MKTNHLFPNSFKKISGVLFVLSLLGLLFIFFLNEDETVQLQVTMFALFSDESLKGTNYFVWTKNNILDEIVMTVFIVSGLLFAFSKEKIEDEMVSKIRLESLVWATYVNYGVLLFCILFIYGLPFLNVMMYNMFTLLLFFIIRFHWMLYKNNTISDDEE